MTSPDIQQLFLFGQDVLSAGIDANSTTGVITAQIGNAKAGTVEADNCEWLQHAGFASIPSSPTPDGKAAQCLAIRQSDTDVIIGSRDTRCSGIYGNLKPGETCLFGGGVDGAAQGRVLIKQDGSVNLMTTSTNAEGGIPVMLSVHPTRGLEFVSQWGTIQFGPNGLTIRHVQGFDIRAYGILGLPGPLASIGSKIELKAGIIKADGMCMLGPDAGTPASPTQYMPAAYSPDPPGAPVLVKGINSMSVKFSTP